MVIRKMVGSIFFWAISIGLGYSFGSSAYSMMAVKLVAVNSTKAIDVCGKGNVLKVTTTKFECKSPGN